MLIEAFDLKVADFRVFEIDVRRVGCVNELPPDIWVHEVVDVIIRGNFNHGLLLLEFEAIHREVTIVLISPHPDHISD